MKATVITDASFCHRTRSAGWAAWIRLDGLPQAVKASGQLRRARTSTLAEIMAALNGAWLAAHHGARIILVQSDCLAVVDLIERGSLRCPEINALWAEFKALPETKGLVLTGRHVKGHGPITNARTYVNDWCDQNARTHMRQGRKRCKKRR